jgi:hypothetical protein
MTRLWFRARSYGWGWTPVTVEGWLVMLAFLVAVGIVPAVFLYQLRHGADPGRATLGFLVGLAILIGRLVAVCRATGERPRWRWGE